MPKLPLYLFDQDQTYDLLYCGNIHPQILNYLGRINGFPLGATYANSIQVGRGSQRFFINIEGISALFDRRTPDGYLWANDYTTKLYNFLKPLTTTGQYDNKYFSGNLITFQGSVEIFGHLDYGEILGDKLTSIIPDGVPEFNFVNREIKNITDDIVYLTWLTPAFVENDQAINVNINYNEEINKGVDLPSWGKVYNKIAVKLYPQESTIIDKFCLLCSLVISNNEGELVSQLDSQISHYYQFKYFDTVFNRFQTDIEEGFKQINNYAWTVYVSTGKNFDLEIGADDPTDEFEDSDIDSLEEVPPDQDYLNPTLPLYGGYFHYTSLVFSPVPVWYYFCTLIYGDESLTDLGKPLKLDLTESGNLSIEFFDPADAGKLIPSQLQEDIVFTHRTVELTPNSPYVDAVFTYHWDITRVRGWETEELALTFEPNYEQFFTVYIDEVFSKVNPETGESQNTNMPDSNRVKEIHAALDAGRFAYYTKDGQNHLRVANLGYYIERLARILGISVNPDGGIRSIRQSKHIPQGKEIPAGWSIAQWGRNNGGDSEGQKGGNPEEQRDGIAYEVIGNRFTTNPFTGEASKIEEGGYVLCENILQYLEILKDDFDKCLGLQVAAANALPSADRKEYITYEGLHTLLAESVYMQSAMSEQQLSALISSISTQAMTQEILAALGLPCRVKEIKAKLAEENLKIPYPGLDSDAPTVFNQFSAVLLNLSSILLAVSQISAKAQLVDPKDFHDQYPELVASNLDQIFDFSIKQEDK